jgi:hypothetical protein
MHTYKFVWQYHQSIARNEQQIYIKKLNRDGLTLLQLQETKVAGVGEVG